MPRTPVGLGGGAPWETPGWTGSPSAEPRGPPTLKLTLETRGVIIVGRFITAQCPIGDPREGSVVRSGAREQL